VGTLAVVAITGVLGLAGCGRLGFDPQPSEVIDAPAADALPGADADPTRYVIATVQLADPAVYSWVELEVDWARDLAYVGTREAGQCFAAIDLATSPPAIVQRRGPPATGGDRCLGIRLESPRRLLVASETAGVIELWDLGEAPRTGNFTRLASIPTTTPRRFAADSVAAGRRFVASRTGIQAFQVNETDPQLVLGLAYAGPACPDSYNDVTHLATNLAITGCSQDLSPVALIDDNSMALDSTLPANNGGLSGFWSAARTEAGGLAVMGGWVSATVVVNVNDPGGWSMLERWDNADVYRTATIVEAPARPVQLWTGTGDGSIEVLELGPVGSPRVIHRAPLGAPGEVYGLAVDPATERAVAVTNRGTLVVVDITQLPLTDFSWPAF
jgi:hypothetical protein